MPCRVFPQPTRRLSIRGLGRGPSTTRPRHRARCRPKQIPCRWVRVGTARCRSPRRRSARTRPPGRRSPRSHQSRPRLRRSRSRSGRIGCRIGLGPIRSIRSGRWNTSRCTADSRRSRCGSSTGHRMPGRTPRRCIVHRRRLAHRGSRARHRTRPCPRGEASRRASSRGVRGACESEDASMNSYQGAERFAVGLAVYGGRRYTTAA